MTLLQAILALIAVGMLAVGWRLLVPSRQLIVDERGIFDRRLRLGCIRWDEIEGAYQPSAQDNELLRLRLRRSERLARRMRRQPRPAAAGGLEPDSLDVPVNLAGTGMAPAELLQIILAHGRRGTPQPATGLGTPSDS